MRLMVMFDLPVATAKERKIYGEFRKFWKRQFGNALTTPERTFTRSRKSHCVFFYRKTIRRPHGLARKKGRAKPCKRLRRSAHSFSLVFVPSSSIE